MPEKILPSGVVIVDTNEATGIIPNLSLNVGQLDRAKRGDFVRLLLKFKIPASDGTPENPKATEFVTGIVSGRTANGLLKVKVYSRPEFTARHSVTYGDDLTLSDRYVLSHDISNEGTAKEVEHVLTGVMPQPEPINPEDAKLRDAAKNLAPIAPGPQQQFWLRNGALVTVYMFHAGVWVGAGNDGSNYEWTATGAHAGGQREFDIVKNPSALEVKHG